MRKFDRHIAYEMEVAVLVHVITNLVLAIFHR